MAVTLVGSTLGRFRVDRLLGRGGMGEVYAAFDEKLEREVALKVLFGEGDVSLQRKRLLREARLAAKLTHPNIATVYEVDELDGRLYIVMELLEGSSLRRILSQRKISIDEALSIARDVARALSRAHAAGVTHRDIKPENVFVSTLSPDTFLVKVLDFGLARQRPATDGGAEATFTTTGEMWGTPGYVSPEQAYGKPVDVRTDIFSFGIILYEMLAGIKPFRGENAVGVLLATTRTDPRPLREINPGVSPELDGIVRRCLMKDREARFADGAELSAAIESFVRALSGPHAIRSVVGSSPNLGVVVEELATSDLVATTALEQTPPTGGVTAIEVTRRDEPVAPLDQQRREHMKLVAAIGSGVALALVVVVVAISWMSPHGRSRRATGRGAPGAAASLAPPATLAAASAGAASAGAASDAPPSDAPPSDAPTAEALDELDDGPAAPSAPAASAALAAAPPASVVQPARAAAPPRKKSADCAEPFKVDAKGVKIPKLHCL